MISQLMFFDGEKNAFWDICCQGTRVKLMADVGADDAAGDCAAPAADAGDVGDVAWADADPEADELEVFGLHPTMATPATARAAPVSNVRRAANLVIFLKPLQGSRRTMPLSGVLSTVRTAQCPRDLHTRHATASLAAGIALTVLTLRGAVTSARLGARDRVVVRTVPARSPSPG